MGLEDQSLSIEDGLIQLNVLRDELVTKMRFRAVGGIMSDPLDPIQQLLNASPDTFTGLLLACLFLSVNQRLPPSSFLMMGQSGRSSPLQLSTR